MVWSPTAILLGHVKSRRSDVHLLEHIGKQQQRGLPGVPASMSAAAREGDAAAGGAAAPSLRRGE